MSDFGTFFMYPANHHYFCSQNSIEYDQFKAKNQIIFDSTKKKLHNQTEAYAYM